MTPPQFLDEDEALIPHKRVSIISAPLANTVSYGTGTDQGPAAIIAASKALESFDDELHLEPFRAGFETLPPLDLAGLSSVAACERILAAVDRELDKERLPLLLGGEHTVTVPAVTACARRHPGLHVVQIDAHLDLRDSFEGSPLSHACIMRRLHDLEIPFTQVGMRSFSREEWEFIHRQGLKPFFMDRLRREADWIEQVCNRIAGPVYITFDVDGLDPAIMPATGTPEPDGLTWGEATRLLRRLSERKKIVGLDFVELAPAPNLHHATFTVAKLIYRTLGYIFRPQLVAGS
jgi:agmatinase